LPAEIIVRCQTKGQMTNGLTKDWLAVLLWKWGSWHWIFQGSFNTDFLSGKNLIQALQPYLKARIDPEWVFLPSPGSNLPEPREKYQGQASHSYMARGLKFLPTHVCEIITKSVTCSCFLRML
jgi:hypothetical protein